MECWLASLRLGVELCIVLSYWFFFKKELREVKETGDYVHSYGEIGLFSGD